MDRIEEAKKAIREFRNDFEQRFQDENSDVVQQVGIYLFQHTKKE
jgi:hypothetical protein